MSAPETNIPKQKKRHGAQIVTMLLAIIVIFVGLVFFVGASDERGVQDPATIDESTDNETGTSG